MNTSSINSWFRWNLVRASVLVEIISFSKPSTSGSVIDIQKWWSTYFFVLIWMHRRSLLESSFSVIIPVRRGAEKNAHHSCYLSLSVLSLERSAFQALPFVCSAGLTWIALSLDLGNPFPSVGVLLAVQVVEVAGDLGGEGVTGSELLALGQAPHQGLVVFVGGLVLLAPRAFRLPYHRACRQAFHLGYYLAWVESPPVHYQERFRLEDRQPSPA